MGSSGRGAKEVLVKISGGGRDADGVQAHFEYIDRHGKLDIETDHGEVLQREDRGDRAHQRLGARLRDSARGSSLTQQGRRRWEAATAPAGVQYCPLDAGGHAARKGAARR